MTNFAETTCVCWGNEVNKEKEKSSWYEEETRFYPKDADG